MPEQLHHYSVTLLSGYHHFIGLFADKFIIEPTGESYKISFYNGGVLSLCLYPISGLPLKIEEIDTGEVIFKTKYWWNW